MFVQHQNFGLTERLQYNFQLNRYDYEAHIHQYAEIGYIISGSLDVTVNGRCETAKEGDFILIFPMQVHGYSTPEYCDAIISAVGNSLTPEYMHGTGESAVFKCCESVEKYFRSTFINGELDGIPMEKPADSQEPETVKHYIDIRIPEAACRIKSIIYALLGEYFSEIGIVRENGANDAMAKVLLYLNEHYKEDIVLTDVASELGYSANYLSHRMKKTLGMSFSSLLGNLRVEQAIKLLNSAKKMRMIDIALESGFSNERSFHRTFKNVTGSTPSEYLQNELYKINFKRP